MNLGQCVISRLLHRACHSESPVVEIHAGVVDVVVVDGELFEGSQVGVSKRGCQMNGAKQPRRCPIAKGKAAFEERFLELRANAPSASTGVSFNNSRRLRVLNLRLSVRDFISVFLAGDTRTRWDSRVSKRLQGDHG